MYKQIINSILDTDLYKMCMMWAVIQKFPNTSVQYKFINRDGRKFTEEMCWEISEQIKLMKSLQLNKDERDFLKEKCYFLPAAYIDFLNGYRYDPSEVSVHHTDDDQLVIRISGWWYRTILWEVPVMAIVSEVYNEHCGNLPTDLDDFRRRTFQKGVNLSCVSFADFGTRRRMNGQTQKAAIQVLKPLGLIGTSNIKFAMDFNIKPIGTQAHEWYMAHGALFGYKAATSMALENWVDVYQGSLGIALTDTYTSDVFFKSFNRKYAKLFDGVRHDSGDPFEFAQKTISHYKRLGIDPTSKTIVFSDALNTEKALEIEEFCTNVCTGEAKIKTSFGIGTFLTNDFPGVKPLNIVIKLCRADDCQCIKLSDDVGKHTGDEDEVKLCQKTLQLI